MKTLIIDNYDSFTYNLTHLFAEISGYDPIVIRNDAATWSDLEQERFDCIVVSPGPGNPEREADFGVSRDAILYSAVPLLGVCLGHQGIAILSGGTVVRAPVPMHGRVSPVLHLGSDIFANIPSPFLAARYHSLHVVKPLPSALIETAWTADGIVMGLAHRTRPLRAVQFHPESIITDNGRQLIANFCRLVQPRQTGRHLNASHKRVESVSRLPAISGRTRAYWREIASELDGEAVFCTLFAGDADAFWLDGGLLERGRSRWSYLGSVDRRSGWVEYRSNPRRLDIWDHHGHRIERTSVLDYLNSSLRKEVENPPPCPFHGGFVGWLGYELRNECGSPTDRRAATPDAVFMRASRFIAIDHFEHRYYIIAVDDPANARSAEKWVLQMASCLGDIKQTPPIAPPITHLGATIRFAMDRSRARYIRDIEQCLSWISDGETYQVCLTNEISCNANVDALSLYRNMRHMNPAPYAAFLRYKGVAVLSASPERFLGVDVYGQVETKPIKGTIARASDLARDIELAHKLRTSEKDRAENVMIVDLLRNDLSRVCETGSVTVSKLFDVESYATVHQLVSTVRGILRLDRSALDLVRATFPGGSMTGAPKLRTLELIDKLEGRARGIYSGALGWFGFDGCADLSIVIRTIVATGGKLTIGVGGGIVAQSKPEAEFAEILLKAQAPIRAIVRTCSGENSEDQFEITDSD